MFNMNKSIQGFLIICINVPLIIKYLDFHLVTFYLSQALLSVWWVKKSVRIKSYSGPYSVRIRKSKNLFNQKILRL